MTDPSRISGGQPKWVENPMYKPATTTTEGVEKAKSFSLGQTKMTQGTATDAPKTSRSFGQKIADFFKGVGRAIANLFTTKQLPPGEAMSKAVGLPKGFQVQDNGVVDFQMPLKLHDTALKAVGLSDHPLPTTPLEFMVAQSEQHMDTDRTVDLPNGGSFNINGEVARDFGRMKVEIPTEDGSFISREETGVEAESRLPESCQHLLAFAGDETSAQVIASFTNQYTIRNLGRVIEGENGNIVMCRPPSAHSPLTVDMPDGETIHSDSAPILRDAHFKLSKTPEGNFKIDLTWPSYAERFGTTETYMEETKTQGVREMTRTIDSPITLEQGHALKQTITMSFTIDAQSASNGQVNILDHSEAMIQFQGKIDVDSTMNKLNGN